MDLEVWDTAGQERYRSLTRSYLRSPDVAIVVFDVTDRNSFLDAKAYIDEISDERIIFDTVYILVANKMDLCQLIDIEERCDRLLHVTREIHLSRRL